MVCPNCGGEIIVEQGRCESCGSYFTPELLKQISHGIKGSAYELTKGDLEKERMLKKADTHLSMGDFDAAIRSYKDVSYEFPDDYRGWLGEINCRTHSFTNFNIGKTAVLSIQNIVDKALLVAPEHQKELIRAKWSSYSLKCIRLEDDRIRKEHEERERIRIQKEQAEEARQRQLAAERARREAEAQEQMRKREAEEERQRLAKEKAERNFKIKKLICSLIILGLEVTFSLLMMTFDFKNAINESIGRFIGVDVALLANALIIGIVDRIGCVKFGTYIASGINAIFAIWIFFSAMGSMDGIIIGVLAFFFFGAIEIGVIWLSYVIANAISTIGT